MWTASARHQYRRTGGRYATDVTDAEFALIEPLLPAAQARRPTPDDVHARGAERLAVPAPHRLPMAHAAARVPAAEHGLRLLSAVSGRRASGRRSRPPCSWRRASRPAARPQPTAAIIDSQSVKTTEAGGPRGFDAGKKVNGRKRHLLTDTLGLPLRLVVHAANVQDRDGLELVCARHPSTLSLAATSVRRCRLPGRHRHVRRRSRALAARDRQAPARSRGLPPAAATLGHRADLRLARPQPHGSPRTSNG